MLGSFKYIFVLSFYHLSIFQGYYKDIVEFYFDERNHCKNFWKKCVEHHGFFRYLYYQIIKWGVAHNCLLATPCCGDRSESWQFVSYKLTANRLNLAPGQKVGKKVDCNMFGIRIHPNYFVGSGSNHYFVQKIVIKKWNKVIIMKTSFFCLKVFSCFWGLFLKFFHFHFLREKFNFLRVFESR